MFCTFGEKSTTKHEIAKVKQYNKVSIELQNSLINE